MEGSQTDDGFARALAIDSGSALVLGTAGSGRTELLARKAAALAGSGVAVERIILLSRTAANRGRLRDRVAELGVVIHLDLDGALGQHADLLAEILFGVARRVLDRLDAGIFRDDLRLRRRKTEQRGRRDRRDHSHGILPERRTALVDCRQRLVDCRQR